MRSARRHRAGGRFVVSNAGMLGALRQGLAEGVSRLDGLDEGRGRKGLGIALFPFVGVPGEFRDAVQMAFVEVELRERDG